MSNPKKWTDTKKPWDQQGTIGNVGYSGVLGYAQGNGIVKNGSIVAPNGVSYSAAVTPTPFTGTTVSTTPTTHTSGETTATGSGTFSGSGSNGATYLGVLDTPGGDNTGAAGLDYNAQIRENTLTALQGAYDAAIAEAGRTKEAAIQNADTGYSTALRNANALYRDATSRYGANAEALAAKGLTGSGYSDYLTAKAHSDRNSAYLSAEESYASALQKAETDYSTAVSTADTALASGKLEAENEYLANLTVANTTEAKATAWQDGSKTFEDILAETGADFNAEAKDLLDGIWETMAKDQDGTINKGLYDRLQEKGNERLLETAKKDPRYWVLGHKIGRIDTTAFIAGLQATGKANAKAIKVKFKGLDNWGTNFKLSVDDGNSYINVKTDGKDGVTDADTIQQLNLLATGDTNVFPRGSSDSADGNTQDAQNIVVYNGELYVYYNKGGANEWHKCVKGRGEEEKDLADIIARILTYAN